MDWFERITGFAELPYEETQRKLGNDLLWINQVERLTA